MIRCCFCDRDITVEWCRAEIGDGRIAHVACRNAYIKAQTPPRHRWFRRWFRR